MLIRQGESPDDLFVLESGRLQVEMVTPEGTRVRLRTVLPGVVVGEIAMYTGVPRTADVVAETPSVVLRLSRASIEQMERHGPGAGRGAAPMARDGAVRTVERHAPRVRRAAGLRPVHRPAGWVALSDGAPSPGRSRSDRPARGRRRPLPTRSLARHRAGWRRCSSRRTCSCAETSRSSACRPPRWGTRPRRARFAREARALARVNDPHVVTVFDIVVDDGRPFLVMELVDGMTLSELIHREGRIDPARVVSIAEDICSGLAAVHACGIVHRDMKPSNVFLTASGAVKIGDFGIASVASDVTVTRAGEVFGSAPYVSPEQVTGDPVDARADLYSLGCVMFEMATGRPPFVGDEPAALAYQHAHTTPERADAVVPQVPTALASTIDRLLAKDPADRPDSADELRRCWRRCPSRPRPMPAMSPRNRWHRCRPPTSCRSHRLRRGDDAAPPAPATVIADPLDRRVGRRDRPVARPQRDLRGNRPRGRCEDAGRSSDLPPRR